MSSVDRSLLSIFAQEQAEHITRVRALLEVAATADASQSPWGLEELLRRLHTLKGAARAVGLDQTEQVMHQAEETLAPIQQGSATFNLPVRSAIAKAMDAAEDILAAILENRDARPAIAATQGELSAPSGANHPAADDVPESAQLVSVDSGRVDELIGDAADLLRYASLGDEMDRAGRLLEQLHGVNKDLCRTVDAFLTNGAPASGTGSVATRDQLAAITRRLSIAERDARSLFESLQHREPVLREWSARIYEDACSIRMTSSQIFLGGFGPMVRDIAQQEGKEIVFQMTGLSTHADRLVLQGLKEPIMHLLRNAVSHGIEVPETRVRSGKAPAGNVTLGVELRGDRLVICIDDDGRGLDYGALRRNSESRGIAVAQDNLEARQQLARLIFRTGLSTANSVTGVSGRGIGLSVVQEAVSRLRGDVHISDRQGGGARAVVTVPVGISTEHVLLVDAAGHTLAIGSSFVESLHRVKDSETPVVNGRKALITENGPVDLVSLASLLDLAQGLPGKGESGIINCAVLTNGSTKTAIVVNRFLDAGEMVIKDALLPRTSLGLISAAIPLGDGTVAPLLNMNGLFELLGETPRTVDLAPLTKPPVRQSRILVADDSLTTRSLEKSILEAHGYEVQLAIDGIDALERLQSNPPDLLISDVMMPRMTGFQLLEKIRGAEATKHLPVILVTSLENSQEQELGLSLGADAYIVKRKFDQRELLQTIEQIL